MSGAAGIQIMSAVYQHALNQLANSANEKALTNAVNRELARQGILVQQNQGYAQQNLQATAPGKKKQNVQQGTDRRMAGYAAGGANPMVSAGARLPVSASDQFRSSILNHILRSSQAGNSAWGDAATDDRVSNMRTNDAIGVNNNFAAGSAALAPAEFNQSQTAGDTYRMWAGIMKSMGGMGSSMMG